MIYADSDCPRQLQKAWKVGEVELMTKGFSEKNRYFNLFPTQRQYGLKFVSPPIAESSLHQLRHEQELFEQFQPNYLKNDLYRLNQQRTMSQSPNLEGSTPKQDLVSLL